MSKDDVFIPCKEESLYSRDWLGNEFDTMAHAPHFLDTVDDQELYAYARVLEGSEICNHAGSALVIGDGVLDKFIRVLEESGCAPYVMDPISGFVFHNRTIVEASALLYHGYTEFNLRTFEALPKFDLILMGCEAFNNKGFVYFATADTSRRYCAIRCTGRIHETTATTVVAPPELDCSGEWREPGHTKVKYRLGPDDVHTFAWWEEQLESRRARKTR
ncbi:MAG: hypothetical protein ISS31_09805 [Kiritimatiellae bacterium]|nr:hypothetical protein [Kiritimatiellia bacterium]